MPRNQIVYEWDYETVDEHGDIQDHNYQVRLKEFHALDITDTLVLVRSVGNNDDGMVDRFWAYVKDGKLPIFFSNAEEQETGYKVPQRFHAELAKYLNI